MRIVVLLTLLAGLALPAMAEPVRMPRGGVPAYAFDAPSGWEVHYDGDRLQFIHPSNNLIVQLGMIDFEDADAIPLVALAAALAESSAFPAPTQKRTGAIAGRAGESFRSTGTMSGIELEFVVTLVHVDKTHIASVIRTARPDTTEAQYAAFDALDARIRIVTRP